MSDVLNKICADKLDHVAQCKANVTLSELEDRAKTQAPVRGFASALKGAMKSGRYGLIAEIKKASPSKGLIREDFNPAELAQAYQAGGASCLSILTDAPYFQGADEYLVQARSAVGLPCLRKDFMLDTYQITEARALGADCILLIMAALEDGQAQELEKAAVDWGMDVLIEVHNAEELDRALLLDSPLIGVNNRNLKTLDVDIQTTVDLATNVPADRILVAESGLYTPGDLARMAAAGAGCFLIGESLMRKTDVEQAVRDLIGNPATVQQRG